MSKEHTTPEEAFRPSTSPEEWTAQGWPQRAEPLTGAPRLETTVSVRFGPDDALLLRRAARMCGQTKSEFIRRATVRAAQKTIDETPAPVSFKALTTDQGRHVTGTPRQTGLTGAPVTARRGVQVKVEIG